MYIYERDNWTDFRWDESHIARQVEDIAREQGMLIGRLTDVGLDEQLKTLLENTARDIVCSSEIEGIHLNMEEVRSSIAWHLGIEMGKAVPASHYVDGVVKVTLSAMQNFDRPIDKKLLCQWQAAFFPHGTSSGIPVETGIYRTHEEHIVSGGFQRERVHYIAPSPERVPYEMDKFMDWFNRDDGTLPSVIRSGIAHLWFVSIHPFEDGNGRLARILGDMMFAKGDHSRFRYYNLSTEINRDKRHYYDILERTQKGDGDITEWLQWYMQTTRRAIQEAGRIVGHILNKSIFWRQAGGYTLNARQKDTLNRFLDGYEAKITTKTWASLNKCSKDTAIRDIDHLVRQHLLVMDVPGAKRPSYSINYLIGQEDFSRDFTGVEVTDEDGTHYLSALYKGRRVKERILDLDAERFLNKDLPLANLLQKYCSYLTAQPFAKDYNHTRITMPMIVPETVKGQYAVRCKVDGVQKTRIRLDNADRDEYLTIKYSGDKSDLQDFTQRMAEKYFKQELEQSNSLKKTR